MLLNLLALIAVFGITTFQSMFGLFSGVINVMCSILALVITFGFGPLVNDLLSQQFSPAYSEPSTIVGLFVVSLAVLRTLADSLIRGNVRMPDAVDWVGGGLCGFVNAQITVGVMATGFLMLPWGGEGFGVTPRYSRTEGRANGYVEFERTPLWTRSDDFATGLFSMLSSGSLRGERTFASVYPSYTDWVFFTSNTMQEESLTAPLRNDGDGFAEGLDVVAWWWQEAEVEAHYLEADPTEEEPKPKYVDRKAFSPPVGTKLLATRLELKKVAADRSDKGAAVHRFRPTMLRVVGYLGAPEAEEFRHYTARILTGVDTKVRGEPRIVNLDDKFSPAGEDVTVDAYFQVDEDFKPVFIEYRRHARAALGSAAEEPLPVDELAVLQTPEEKQDSDRVRRRGFIEVMNQQQSGASIKLPYVVARRFVGPNAELQRNRLVSGRVTGFVEELRGDRSSTPVTDFVVPEDQNLVHVRYDPRRAQSLPGQVLSFAGQLNSYFAVDNEGDRHELVGYYGTVTRSGGNFMELYYSGFGDSPDALTFRGQLDFKDIKHRELSGRRAGPSQVGLLFLCPPGRSITELRTSSGKSITGLRIATGRPGAGR